MGAERPRLGMHDVRLSLTLGDNLLTQLPLSMKKIMAGGWYERDYEVDVREQFEDPELDPELVRMLEEASMTDLGLTGENGGGGGVLLPWDGAEKEDRMELRGILDDCLAMGV